MVANFVNLIGRILGTTDPEAARRAVSRPWVSRGISNSVDRLGITSTDDAELSSVWSFAFEAGAVDALQFARVVLGDPACKGREHEALKLIEQGLGYSAVVAALRAPQGAQAGGERTVVAFPAKGGRA